MAKIINFPIKEKLTAVLLANPKCTVEPDDECVLDINGNVWYLYSFTYFYQDCEWCLEIWAKSQEDAENRAAAIRDSIKDPKQIIKKFIYETD